MIYLIYSNVLGFHGRMLEQKSDSFGASESTATTNTEVNHLFNVALGADFLGKVWPCRKKGNASNSNKPEACFLESFGIFDKHCCHVKKTVKTSKLTVAHASKPLKTEWVMVFKCLIKTWNVTLGFIIKLVSIVNKKKTIVFNVVNV